MKLHAAVVTALLLSASAQDDTFLNPIIPGFHPDPTCAFVPELDNTFFCTFSSFLTFPGLPVYASRDLINWKHTSNALSRPEQLPALAFIQRGSTSGIYAPTLRYRDGKLIIVTTLANQALYPTNYTKWDNFIVTSEDPYSSSSWSDPVHFDFPGIDPSPFWDDDGQTYFQASYDGRSILQAPIDLDTGEVTGPLTPIWNGTGLPSPEAPHMYKKDGWYYLLTAEGGTRERHRANMARSRKLYGPHEADPANPVLSNHLTDSYFQAVGHADIFPDGNGNYWAIALGVRAAGGYSYNLDPYNSIFPMGREGLLTPVSWPTNEWPTFMNISGTMTGNFRLPEAVDISALPGEGTSPFTNDAIDFAPDTSLPPHLFHWRLPIAKNYAISPPNHPNTVLLRSSVQNLTAYDADSTRGLGQTFLARKQAHTRFRFSVDVDHTTLTRLENEVGVSALMDQAQHFDLSVVMLPSNTNTSSSSSSGGEGELAPHIRFRGISTTTYRLPSRFKYIDEAFPFPTTDAEVWQSTSKIRLQIEAVNITHYVFSAGPVPASSRPSSNTDAGDTDIDTDTENVPLTSFGSIRSNYLIPYYSGVVVGAYATSNGKYGEGAFETYISRWRYEGLEQVRDVPPAGEVGVVWD